MANGEMPDQYGPFSPKSDNAPEQITEAYPLRARIEEMFKDPKENEGKGIDKQQTRKLDSNIGSSTLCPVICTTVELRARTQSDKELTRQSSSD